MAKKTTSKMPTDTALMKAYNLGWDDCFDGDNSNIKKFKNNKLLIGAYNLGWSHYIIGDDVRSVDYLSKVEILECIKSVKY